MNRPARPPAFVLGVAALGSTLLLTGCGGHRDVAGSGATRQSPAQSTGTTHSSPRTGGDATAVSVVRDGGLKGNLVHWTFTRDGTPPAGHTAADVRHALRAASAPGLARTELPAPTSWCCDRYRFRITIRYANGSTKRFSTVDGEPWPRVFRALVRAVS